MEIQYILMIDIFCICLGILGLYKIPLSAFFGMIIGITVGFYEIIDVGITDIGIRMLTIVTIVICCVCFIGGYKRNA